MSHKLTICLMTNRREPMADWFFQSLWNQLEDLNCPHNNKFVIVDFYAGQRTLQSFPKIASVVAPKPCVWQGEHRLTKENYFAASNARNTALCLAYDGYIVFCDDLSVLMPGWLNAVKEAMEKQYVVCGAYKKVKNLKVENGIAVSYDEFPGGIDCRWNQGNDTEAVPIDGGQMFGCSVGMPVEWLLQINGWPEDLADSLGSEDYLTGIVLQNNGFPIRYDRRMLTLESEELHHVEQAFKRSDFGVSPNDKSHAALNIARASKRFPNHFDIRLLRQRTLAGEPFPIDLNPQHEWWTGKPIKDL